MGVGGCLDAPTLLWALLLCLRSLTLLSSCPPAPALDGMDLNARVLILPPTPCGLGQVPTPLCVRGQSLKKEK